MLEDTFKIEGRLRAFDEEENKILDTKNLILDEGMNYIQRILAAEHTGSEAWYTTNEGEEYAVESIAIGDDNTSASGSDTDLIGNQINEGAVQRTDEAYGFVEDEDGNIIPGHFSYVFEVTNSSGSSESHWEAVITNNQGVTESDRICISRITFDNAVALSDGDTINYVWDLILERG